MEPQTASQPQAQEAAAPALNTGTVQPKAVGTLVKPRKTSPHLVNLLILLIISILLCFQFVFPDLSAQLQQLRFFVPFANSPDLLGKLLPLRIGIGFVFLWYGFDNFEHPEIFNNLSNTVLKKMHLEKDKLKLYPFAYMQSALEILVAFSCVTGAFLDLGAFLGCLLLSAVLFAYEEGLGSLLIRDIGLLGATVSLFIMSIVR